MRTGAGEFKSNARAPVQQPKLDRSGETVRKPLGNPLARPLRPTARPSYRSRVVPRSGRTTLPSIGVPMTTLRRTAALLAITADGAGAQTAVGRIDDN